MQYFCSICAEKRLLTIFNYTLPYPIVKGTHPIFSSLYGTKNLPILPASALLFHAVNHNKCTKPIVSNSGGTYMHNDCIDENLTDKQRERFRTCWVLLADQSHKNAHMFTLRPYLYEQFFAPKLSAMLCR